MKKLIFLVPVLLFLGACAHINDPPQLVVESVNTCVKEVRMGVQARIAHRVNVLSAVASHKNELAIPMLVMANAMADMKMGDPFASCNGALIAYIQEEGGSISSVNSVIGKSIGIGGMVWGADILGSALTGVAGTAGTHITANGSRITSGNTGSGTFSSSGEGLGTGTTFASGSSAGIGGFQPRANGSAGASQATNESNSGTNESLLNDGNTTLPLAQ